MEVLRVEKLFKAFGGILAICNVSFKIEEGERVAIIGPNGAGKTTLFNLLTGQMKPSSGKIYFYGKDITFKPAHIRIHLGMARSFQIVSLFPNLSVLENTLLSLDAIQSFRYQLFKSVSGYKSLYSRAEEMLSLMELWGQRAELVHTISYGDQRKLEIALSLATNPKLLLLDEPSCGLTTTESADITSRIHNLGTDITVLLVAHDMDLVYGVAQRIIVLHYGETIMQGTPDEIKCSEKIKEIYMGAEEGV